MSNTLEALLNEIQIQKRLTLDQIAEKIGYSRPHLNKAKLKGSNDKIERLLKNAFPDVLPNITKGDVTEKYLALLEKWAAQDLGAVKERLSMIESKVSENNKLLKMIVGDDSEVPDNISYKKPGEDQNKPRTKDGKGKQRI